MGLDVTVYLSPTPATEHEIAVLRSNEDRDAALVGLDRLRTRGAFMDAGEYASETIDALQQSLMSGGPLPEDWVHVVSNVLDLRRPHINPDFPARAAGLDYPAYRVGGSWWLKAGPYSRYGRWREGLARMVGVATPPDPGPLALGYEIPSLHEFWERCGAIEADGGDPGVPFWQLLHFSDCEGVIGPVVSARLAADFDAWADRAAKVVADDDREGYPTWAEMYEKWRKAFRDAANTGGWVAFH